VKKSEKKKKKKKPSRAARLRALKRESERADLELIRARLALRPEERMDFLRVRMPGGGSAL
jgi:hypothetical protein